MSPLMTQKGSFAAKYPGSWIIIISRSIWFKLHEVIFATCLYVELEWVGEDKKERSTKMKVKKKPGTKHKKWKKFDENF